MTSLERSKRKEIAPLLVHGWRDRLYGRLPHAAKEDLKAIAIQENKSVSWVLEETIIRYFKLKRPMYKQRKKS